MPSRSGARDHAVLFRAGRLRGDGRDLPACSDCGERPTATRKDRTQLTLRRSSPEAERDLHKSAARPNQSSSVVDVLLSYARGDPVIAFRIYPDDPLPDGTLGAVPLQSESDVLPLLRTLGGAQTGPRRAPRELSSSPQRATWTSAGPATSDAAWPTSLPKFAMMRDHGASSNKGKGTSRNGRIIFRDLEVSRATQAGRSRDATLPIEARDFLAISPASPMNVHRSS